MFLLGLVIGTIVGALIGVIVMSLCIVSNKTYEDEDI